MCCRKKKKPTAATPAVPQPPSKKDVPPNQVNKENSQKNKEPAKSTPAPHEAAEKPIKDGSKKSARQQEDLDAQYAAPGPANILPKIDPVELKEAASEVFPAVSLKVCFDSTILIPSLTSTFQKNGASGDKSAEKMSIDNTLKEVPRRMPETEILHDKDSVAQVFTNEQLL